MSVCRPRLAPPPLGASHAARSTTSTALAAEAVLRVAAAGAEAGASAASCRRTARRRLRRGISAPPSSLGGATPRVGEEGVARRDAGGGQCCSCARDVKGIAPNDPQDELFSAPPRLPLLALPQLDGPLDLV